MAGYKPAPRFREDGDPMNRSEWGRLASRGPALLAGGVLAAVAVLVGYNLWAGDAPAAAASTEPNLLKQTAAEAQAKSAGCVACHQNVHDPHDKATLHLGCV